MIDGKNRARDKKTNVRMQWLLNYFKYPCSNGLITPLSVEVAQFRTLRRVESLLSDSKSLTFNSKGLCFIRDSLLYPVKGKFAIDVVYEWTGSYIDADSHEDSDLFNERTNREYFVCTAKSRILPPQGIGSTRDLLERIQEARLRRNSSPGEIPTPLLIQTLLNAR